MSKDISSILPANRYSRWIGGFLLLMVVAGMILPSRAHVERELAIDAHPATVFALLNDFRQMEKWSPKADGDPNARIEFVGPPRGVGAGIVWSGQIVGQGRQIIRESQPFSNITSVVDQGGGDEASISFHLEEIGNATLVVWSWQRDYGWNFAGRLLGLIQKGIIGTDLEEGLTSLSAFAEQLPRADFSDLQVEQILVEAVEIAYLPTTSIPEATAISEAMGDSYFEILSFIDEYGLQEAGAPISITREFSGSELVFDAAIPVRGVTAATPRGTQPVKIGTTYEGPVIRVRHVGSYGSLGQTHGKIAAYLAALGIERNGSAWESYISDPTRTVESELLTYVYYPIRNPG
jgi:effector-binding domain-containing protein